MVEWIDVALGAVAAIVASPITKNLIIAVFPRTAPFFAFFNPGQKQLAEVINRADGDLHKNEDLKEWAIENGLKIAANLIKK